MMRMLAVLLIAWACVAQAAPPLDAAHFTDLYAAEARKAMPGSRLQIIGPLEIELVRPDGSSGRVHLHNAYAQYSSAPERLHAILASHVAAHQISPAERPELSTLMAVLKSAEAIEASRKQAATIGAPPGADFVYEPVGEGLFAMFVFDSEQGMRYLTTRDLSERQLDIGMLAPLARKNIDAYFARHGLDIALVPRTGSARVYVVRLDENYEASILLLADYWTPARFPVRGEIVAFAPARNLVLVTGSEDAQGLRIARHVAQQAYREMGYVISPLGYVRREGKWHVHRAP